MAMKNTVIMSFGARILKYNLLANRKTSKEESMSNRNAVCENITPVTQRGQLLAGVVNKSLFAPLFFSFQFLLFLVTIYV